MEPSIKLPERTKWYISQKGLPQAEVFELRFLKPEDFYSTSWRGEPHITVAVDEGISLLCIDREGLVYSIEISGEEKRCFVASSLEQFLQQVQAYNQLEPLPPDCSEMQLQAQAGYFAEKLVALDESALLNEDGFWTIFLEQMAAGLL